MPKSGTALPKPAMAKIRKAVGDILKANKDLKAAVDAKVKGLKGTAQQKARAKAVNNLIKRNAIFRDAVRAKLKSIGVK